MTLDEFCSRQSTIELLDEYVQESFYTGDFSTMRAFTLVLSAARLDDIDIEDQNDVDYDSYFTNWYNSTEKGLS